MGDRETKRTRYGLPLCETCDKIFLDQFCVPCARASGRDVYGSRYDGDPKLTAAIIAEAKNTWEKKRGS